MFSFFKKYRTRQADKGPVQARRCRLFSLLTSILDSGGIFARIRDVDDFISNFQPAIFLKHDVHGVPLDGLLKFAKEEASIGVRGSYFFMAPNHPLTVNLFTEEEQLSVMRKVQQMGHEIGLHIDPYFLIEHLKIPLSEILHNTLNKWRENGIDVCCANMHGNSRYKGLDNNGYGTSFDLFSEIARQPDFPELENVSDELKCVILENKVHLKDFGLRVWGDMPMWSAENKYVVTNYLSDNFLGKGEIMRSIVHDNSLSRYNLCDYQPPGSRNIVSARESVDIGDAKIDCKQGVSDHDFYSESFSLLFQQLSTCPLQVLIHPQYYI